MMNRVNTVGWNDCERLQRRLHKLSEAMMKYQKKTYQEDKGFAGDSDIIVNCIEVFKDVQGLIAYSAAANNWDFRNV